MNYKFIVAERTSPVGKVKILFSEKGKELKVFWSISNAGVSHIPKINGKSF